MSFLSIIIPVYNEEKYIGHLIYKILKEMGNLNYKYEIIIVNDGSTDNTEKILDKFKNKVKVFHKENEGKGSAVKLGIHQSNGEYILIQDGDLEYNPKDYGKMFNKVRENNVIIGSRTLNLSKKLKGQALGPWLFNKLLSKIYYKFFNKVITDSLSGYKIYPTKFLKSITIDTNGFETDHELICKAIKQKIDIVEVAVEYKPRTKKEGKKINSLDALKAIYTITKYR